MLTKELINKYINPATKEEAKLYIEVNCLTSKLIELLDQISDEIVEITSRSNGKLKQTESENSTIDDYCFELLTIKSKVLIVNFDTDIISETVDHFINCLNSKCLLLREYTDIALVISNGTIIESLDTVEDLISKLPDSQAILTSGYNENIHSVHIIKKTFQP